MGRAAQCRQVRGIAAVLRGSRAGRFEAAKAEPSALLIVLLDGEAGLRCGEIMALEWRDMDLTKRQVCVQRSEWKGHVTIPKGGRLR